ncbi:MAG: class I SAM-dependent methyltransferase [Chlamydiota bacterium]
MAICCSRIVRTCLVTIGFLDEEEPDISKEEVNKRFQKEHQFWIPRDRKVFWGGFAQNVHLNLPRRLGECLNHFKQDGIKPGVAIELGWGNNPAVPYLLKNGWEVIAVDNSPQVLKSLQQRVHETVSDKEKFFTAVCSDIETYQFPKNVRLILASFPYCNPLKVVEVWNRAYDSLERGGRMVGVFFPHLCNPRFEAFARGLMGSSYTDKATVKALLKSKGYEIEICDYSEPRFKELLFDKLREIDFMGKKV